MLLTAAEFDSEMWWWDLHINEMVTDNVCGVCVSIRVFCLSVCVCVFV